jgi:hypothetical protein
LQKYLEARLKSTRNYQRFGAGEYLPTIVLVFHAIEMGFFAAIGKDLWEKLKKELASVIANRKTTSEIEFNYSYQGKDVELHVTSADGKVIAEAFDQIQHTLEIVEKEPEDSIYLEFDAETNEWRLPKTDRKKGERKVVFRFQGVMANQKKKTSNR